jgi:hypothetical protein
LTDWAASRLPATDRTHRNQVEHHKEESNTGGINGHDHHR